MINTRAPDGANKWKVITNEAPFTTLSTQHQKACRANQIRQVYFILNLENPPILKSTFSHFIQYLLISSHVNDRRAARMICKEIPKPVLLTAEQLLPIQKGDTGLIARRCRKFLIEFFDLTAKNKHGQIGPPCIKQNTIYSNCPNYGCLWFGPMSMSTRDKEVFCIGVSPEYWKRYKK